MVLLFILNVANVSPLLLTIGPLHSPPPVVTTVGEASTGEVGRGGIVGEASGVSVGVSVGGMGVSVGMAAWVSATIVLAAATAEACTWEGSMVGAAFGAHALIRNARIVPMIRKGFMV